MEELAIEHWALEWLLSKGLSENTAAWLTITINVAILALVSLLVDFVARRVILHVVTLYVKRSKNTYDDVFLEKRVFQSLAHVIPATLIWYSLPLFFESADTLMILRKMLAIYIIIVLLGVSSRFFKAVEHIGLKSEKLKGKPVSSYVQVFKIIVNIVGVVFIISMLVGKSPITILTAFGAATAIVLLIFKDTILGLVASIQISSNDMVRVGDWVSMEKYGADGDVLEINLTTVKIRNFDKTITTVPTYAFISDSFKNWRGMESTGVRRIKRSIYLDISSVKFVTDEMRERFEKITLINGFIQQRQKEIDDWNREKNTDKNVLINGRHMTNIGVFRHYAHKYLLNNPKIDQSQTVMVRQLQPTEVGIPMEIYCFSSDIVWVNYENIQADIFDHLLAAAKIFELRVFQNPSGSDFARLSSRASE